MEVRPHDSEDLYSLACVCSGSRSSTTSRVQVWTGALTRLHCTGPRRLVGSHGVARASPREHCRIALQALAARIARTHSAHAERKCRTRFIRGTR